jgi:lysophospholipase L1-like esterase
MAISITRKYLVFRWLAPDLTLNTSTAPWLSNVLKLTGLTTPNGVGLNARSNYTGAFGGVTPGGTLQRLVQNADYELVSGVYNGWQLPTAIEVFSLLSRPTISSLSAFSVQPGDTLNITGTNLATTALVVVGGLAAAIVPGSTTSTNVALVIPAAIAPGSNIPVEVCTLGGYAVVKTLTVTTTMGKLDTPVIASPVSVVNNNATFTWGAITGADSYRVRINSGTLFMPGNVTSYTVTGVGTSNSVTAEVQALDSTAKKSASDYSASVTATASGAAMVIYPIAANYAGNSYDESTGIAGVKRFSSLARLLGSTNAPYLDVEVFTNVNNQYAPNQGVVVLDANNTLLQKLVSATKTAPSTVRVTLSGAQQTIKFVLPDVANGDGGADGSNLVFGAIRSITVPGGFTFSIVQPEQSPALGLYTINDSIFNGAGVDTPQVDGVAPRLMALMPGLEIAIDGWNGRQSSADYVGVLGRAQKFLTGATTKLVLVELGTNDKLTGSRTPDECATRVVNMAGYMRDNISGSKVFVQTPLITQDENGTNALGFKMSDYRAAIITAVNGSSNLTLVDGTAILSPATDFNDPVHPNAVGNSKYADYLQGVFVPGSVSQPYHLTGTQYIKLPNTATAVSATSFSLAFMMTVSQNQVSLAHVWAMRKGSFSVKNYNQGGDTQTWLVDGTDGGGFGGSSPLIEADQTYFVGISLGASGTVWIVGNQGAVTTNAPISLLQNAVDVILGARQNNDNSFTDFTDMGVKNVSFWNKELTVQELQSLRIVNAKVPAGGPLNYQDPSCLIFAPMGLPDASGQFANLAEPSSPLLLATA